MQTPRKIFDSEEELQQIRCVSKDTVNLVNLIVKDEKKRETLWMRIIWAWLIHFYLSVANN